MTNVMLIILGLGISINGTSLFLKSSHNSKLLKLIKHYNLNQISIAALEFIIYSKMPLYLVLGASLSIEGLKYLAQKKGIEISYIKY